MSQAELQIENSNRPALIKKGRYLEYFTIGYNSLEGLIAVAAGLMTSSIALVGFGFDSLIEVTSGAVLLWRLHADVDEERRERVEAFSLRIVGACFVVLASVIRNCSSGAVARDYAFACQSEKESSTRDKEWCLNGGL